VARSDKLMWGLFNQNLFSFAGDSDRKDERHLRRGQGRLVLRAREAIRKALASLLSVRQG